MLWAKKDFMETVALVRRQVRRDLKSDPSIPPVAEKDAPVEQQMDSIYNNMMWYLEKNKDSDAHYRLKFALYQDSYDKDKVVTHVYSDCARNLQKWKSQGIKLFIFSHAWVNTQRLFMTKSNHGELFSLIDGFYDGRSIGPMSDPASYQKLSSAIGIPASDLLFLTKDVSEGNAAKQAGIHSILVISHGHQLKRYNPDDLAAFERIRSFDELIWAGEGSSTGSQTGSQAASGTGSKVGSQVVGSQSGSKAGSQVIGSQAASGTGSKAGSQVVGSQAGSMSGSKAGSKAGSQVVGSQTGSQAGSAVVTSQAGSQAGSQAASGTGSTAGSEAA